MGGDGLGLLYQLAVFDYAVMPVARKVSQQVEEGRPAPGARRLIMSSTSLRVIGLSVSCRCRSTLRNSGFFFWSAMRAAAR